MSVPDRPGRLTHAACRLILAQLPRERFRAMKQACLHAIASGHLYPNAEIDGCPAVFVSLIPLIPID